MKNRLGIAFGLAALIVAALGTSSVGQAAGDALKASVGNAKIAGPLASQATPRGKRGPRGRRGPRGLTGARGPAGLTGATGATGATGQKGDKGDLGPTYGAADTTSNVPLTPITGFLKTLNVNLPTSGNLLVIGRLRSTIACSATPCAANYSLYVDGTPIPASNARQAGPAGPDNLITFGIALNVPAGPHEIKIALTATGGWNSIGNDDLQLTTVLLGGSSAASASSAGSAAGSTTTFNR